MLELQIPLCTSEDNINPDPHGFRRWSHQVVGAIGCLHAECHFGVGRLDTVQVVHVDLLDRLEEDPPLGLGLRLVTVVDQDPLQPVEDEPPLVPRFELGSHFVEVAPAGAGVEDDVRAQLDLVSGGLDVLPEVEVLVADWKVSSQGTLLLRNVN